MAGGISAKAAVAAALLAALGPCGAAAAALSLAPVVGDVGATSAVLWARTDSAGALEVELEPAPEAEVGPAEVSEGEDFTASFLLEGLSPATEYAYTLSLDGEEVGGGAFSTAPADDEAAAVTIAFTGDIAGQNVCRDEAEGFPIFKAVAAEQADIFVGLGDMIYADGVCEEVGKYGNAQVPGGFDYSFDMPNFWAHWEYLRADEAFANVTSSASYVGIWDDHEIVNDAGPYHDTRNVEPYEPGVSLLPLATDAFLHYNPIISAQNPDTPNRLYRSLPWGSNVELFVLDTRQYRDSTSQLDSVRADRPGFEYNSGAGEFNVTKSLLGLEQRAWLQTRLEDSEAQWKVIVSSVPAAIPTGSQCPEGWCRDGWANYDQPTGYENELAAIWRAAAEAGVRNLVHITTDVHFGEAFKFTPFADIPDFVVYELVVGPGNAGLYPNPAYDTSLGAEQLWFYGPESSDSVTTWEEARKYFNYGVLSVSEDGVLTIRASDVDGETLFELEVEPVSPA